MTIGEGTGETWVGTGTKSRTRKGARRNGRRKVHQEEEEEEEEEFGFPI